MIIHPSTKPLRISPALFLAVILIAGLLVFELIQSHGIVINMGRHAPSRHPDSFQAAREVITPYLMTTFPTCPNKDTKIYYSVSKDRWVIICALNPKVWHVMITQTDGDGEIFEVTSGKFRADWVNKIIRAGDYVDMGMR